MEILLQSIPIHYFTLLLLSLAFGLSFWMIPKLISIIRNKNLMDDPNGRSSHAFQTPTLGGFVFYVVIIMCLFLLKDYDKLSIGFHLIPALTILFFVGLKDDLMVLDPKKKIIAQLIAISFILLEPELLPVNFYGFLGLDEVPMWLSIGSSYFIVLSVINSYNLIDGIDGLAAMVGIVVFTFFSFVFYNLDMYYYSLLAVVCIGFLIAFLRYNLSDTNKIFMGDTGSMIVGFLIGFMSLRFLSLEPSLLRQIQIVPDNLFLITLAVLFVMLIDTIRVVIIRLINKRAAFSPDRNHVHHILIDHGMTHLNASLLIASVNVMIILLFFGLNDVLSPSQLFMLFLGVSFLIIIALFSLNVNYSALKQKIKIRSFFVPKRVQTRYKEFKVTGVLVGIIRIFF